MSMNAGGAKSILIISPSATIKDNPESVGLCTKGENILRDLGYEVTYSKNAANKFFYKSGTVEERASDLERAFSDQNIEMIFCSQGGENSNELLPYINWNIIKNNPKKFFGASDITVLLNAIYVHTGQITYHGLDLMWGLGKNATEYTIENLKKLVIEDSIICEHNPSYANWISIKQGVAQGICLGGCLPSFCLLFGTEHDPLKNINKPFILIIESIGETISRIESYIAQVFQHPNFQKFCKGIIVGYFFMCREEIEENCRNIRDIIVDYAKNYDFPIIEISELGHAVENIIFPIGGLKKIEAAERFVKIVSIKS